MKYLIIYLLALNFGAAIAKQEATFPIPQFFKLRIISDEMSFNGINLSISEFESSKNITDIEGFYRKEWGEAIRKVEYGNWLILSHLTDSLLYTVQVNKPKDGSIKIDGTISISNIPGLPKNFQLAQGEGFPQLPRTTVINDIKTTDFIGTTRTLYLQNRTSLISNMTFYEERMEGAGWIKTNKYVGNNKLAGSLNFRKGNDDLNLSFTYESSKTEVLAILVNKH